MSITVSVNFVVYVLLFCTFCRLLVKFVVCECQFPIYGMQFPFWAIFPMNNNSSPCSQLSKCVEIMLIGVVLIKKNAERSKKASSEKNPLPHISTMGAL